MKNMRIFSIFLAFAAALTALIDCTAAPGASDSNGGGSSATYTLSLTLQQPVGGSAGLTAYAKLVPSTGNVTSPALYSNSMTFPAGAGNTYGSISGIAPGNYLGYIFIDANGDAAADNFLPDHNEYSSGGPISITADLNNTVTAIDWTPFP